MVLPHNTISPSLLSLTHIHSLSISLNISLSLSQSLSHTHTLSLLYTDPRVFMLFSKNFPSRSEIRILSFDLGENPPFPYTDFLVPIAITNTNANYIAYDVVGNRVYWIEEDIQSPPTIPPTIKRAFLDGTGMEVFINTSISAPRDLAIDPYSRNLYWVDSHFRTVMVASLSNPAVRTTILTVGDQPPFGFDLDISQGLVEDWREGRRVGNGRRWYVVEEERGGVYEGGWRC